jgi:hypothetical protein
VRAAASRHPSDADRERDAIEALERLAAAATARDLAGLTACLDGDVVLLEEEGKTAGAEAVAGRVLELAGGAAFDPPQQQGAKAVLRHTREVGIGYTFRGALVVEVRRGLIVFAATL